MSGGPKVMVVEDDVDIADALAAILEDRGYAVVTARNGRDALEKLRANTELPGLILLDLMMPILDGRQFRSAQQADPKLADVPVIILSAHVEIREAAAEMAVHDWLTKPIDVAELLKRVACQLAR